MKKTILLSFVTLLLISCKKDIYNTKPTANFTVNTDTGTVVTKFLFDASDCTDKEDATTELQVRWDFDSDSIWDTEWDTAKTEVFRFDAEGSYTATLEVTDTEGLTSKQTTSLTIDNRGINYQSFVDERDGKEYYYVQIGDQYWMAENLNYDAGSGSWAYGYNSSNATTYGRLYDWKTACAVCPDGWHLPSDGEWVELTYYLGGVSVAGGKMKRIGTSHWNPPNEGASNESGFSALPGGLRYYDGSFHYMGDFAYFWSSTERGSYDAWRRLLSCNYTAVLRYDNDKNCGFSVRCVKD